MHTCSYIFKGNISLNSTKIALFAANGTTKDMATLKIYETF